MIKKQFFREWRRYHWKEERMDAGGQNRLVLMVLRLQHGPVPGAKYKMWQMWR
jgi:hypothetical protein